MCGMIHVTVSKKAVKTYCLDMTFDSNLDFGDVTVSQSHDTILS